MLNLLEPNRIYKNLKKEIIELFPALSPYKVSSIYGETLRGQIVKRKILKKEKISNFKWKKLYYKNPGDKKKYKSYLIKLPNFFENICPYELNKENMSRNLEEINKVLALICREKAHNFEKIHALTILVLWEQAGRFRTIEKNFLFNEIKGYSNVEQNLFESVLFDLVSTGFIVNIGTEYGIKRQIRC